MNWRSCGANFRSTRTALSTSNCPSTDEHKVSAYLRSGAVEVIVIDLKGRVHYHRRDGVHAKSSMQLTLSPPEEMFGE